jgi:hypothetical protein
MLNVAQILGYQLLSGDDILAKDHLFQLLIGLFDASTGSAPACFLHFPIFATQIYLFALSCYRDITLAVKGTAFEVL